MIVRYPSESCVAKTSDEGIFGENHLKRISKVFCITTICTLLAACSSSTPGQLPTPQIKVTTAPDVDSTITTFLTAWKTSDYDSMYSLLSTSSKNMVSPDDFRGVYEDAALNMTLSSMDAELLRTTINPTTATAATRVEYHTGRFGDFEREITIPLMMEDSEWRIIWENGLILPELTGGNRLVMEAIWGERGAIFDRNGEPIAYETTAYALAITPNQIADGKEGALLYQLEELTGRTAESIKESYADIRLTNWYVAVGEASEAEVQERWNILEGLGGLQLIPFESRYYYNGGIAPQAVGYVLPISEEQVAEYSIKGYLGDEPVGQAGLEKYFEEELAGIPAASLYVVDANGKIISRLNQADPTPPQDITTTIDRNLQLQAQRALLGFRGAIVVMEVSTGRILTMASSPGFDQNLFTPENRNSQELLGDMLNDGQQRLLNRVTQGTYPLGSVFKIIGMAAALESDLYEPDTTYYCGSYFEE